MLFSTEAFSSHAAGMDISYECISQGSSSDTYKFTLKFYRDCDGAVAPGNGSNPLMNLNYSSSCGSGSDTLYQVGSVVDINPICSSSCNGGNSFGIEQYTYEATINLSKCSDWVFSVCENLRNSGINTIVNPGGDLCVEATINNTTYCNNSPTFTQYPTPFICAGNLYCYNNGAIEIDGDSLVYSLITPLNSSNGGTVTFIAPYSSINPVGGGSLFDPITGNLCITPTSILSGVLAIKVKEYRNGVLIGSIIRDIQINVFNCGTTTPPTLSEIDSSTIVDINDINSYTVEVCTDGLENINFDINTINPQPPPPASANITITIDTQNWGDEISWDITSFGTVVASGDNYANYNSYTITACVPIGSLIFNTYDSFGNGWSGGTYSITGNPTLTGTISGTLTGAFNGSNNFSISGGIACIPSVNQGALVTMSWNNGITGATYTITNNNSLNPTGTFYLTPSIADIAGSPYYFTVNVTNTACPTPGNFSFQYQIILNSFTDTSSQIATEIECTSYLWPITNTVYSNSGTYIQASSSANGCNHLDSLILIINNPTTSYDTVSNCDSYNWNGITFYTSGDYNFNLINSAGCDSIANLNLTILDSTSLILILEINQDDICVGSPSFTLNQGKPNGGDYFIDDINTNFFDVENLEDGAYTIRYDYTDNITNCSNSIEKIININPNPIADFSFSPQPTDIDNPAILFVNESENIDNTKWSLGDGTTLIDELEFWYTYADTGTYEIIYVVNNEFNCVDSTTATLIINPVYQIFIPSAFTPNNDGDNDNFKVEIIGQKEYTMIIFNKWGGVIFQEKNGIWDGTINNNAVQHGLYSYSILVNDFKNKPFIYTGTVTLIK
jgi:gliding motility-associated-like protein